jgi:Domain of unknown function (DUF4440)
MNDSVGSTLIPRSPQPTKESAIMNRRTMLATLGSAALLPVTRALANSGHDRPSHSSCDRKLKQTIVALETLSWNATKMENPLKVVDALYSADFFEVLADGSMFYRDDVMEMVRTGDFLIDSFTLSEIDVVPTTETAAVLVYRIDASYYWQGVPYNGMVLRVTSTYAKICGQWKNTSYHESIIA